LAQLSVRPDASITRSSVQTVWHEPMCIFQHFLLIPVQSVSGLLGKCLLFASCKSSFYSKPHFHKLNKAFGGFLQVLYPVQHKTLPLYAQRYYSVTKLKPHNHVNGYNSTKHYWRYMKQTVMFRTLL
jgi:hypothetical protein